MIFLHGWTMGGAIFDDLIARMGPGYACFAPDLPGHGRAADLPPTLEAGAGLVADLIADKGLDEVLLVGWSMGAAVAWTYLRDHGAAEVAGLVTVDMAPRMACGPDWPHGLIGQDSGDVAASTRRFETDWTGGAEAIAATMFADKAGPPAFPRDRALAQILSNDPGRMCAVWRALATMDLRAVIGGIELPYLACFGARSRVYPASAAEWLATEARQGRVHGFGGSGHSPHLEEPEEFARVIGAFAEDLQRDGHMRHRSGMRS